MKINGIEEEISSNTLEGLLKEKGYDIQRVAVELNGTVVSRSLFSETPLSCNDVLEIVHFVGGG